MPLSVVVRKRQNAISNVVLAVVSAFMAYIMMVAAGFGAYEACTSSPDDRTCEPIGAWMWFVPASILVLGWLLRHRSIVVVALTFVVTIGMGLVVMTLLALWLADTRVLWLA